MKQRSVVFAPEAQADLLGIYDWLAEAANLETAYRFVMRAERYCEGLSHASERGQSRNDIRPGLRVVGFERRLTIAFAVAEERVTILRVFYRGRNWHEAFPPPD